MSSPVVSIVIPAYNHERFVGEAIESVLAQTYPDLELIVIDDGSTDRTFEIAQQFEDRRIRLHRQENIGLSATLNKALRLAQGRFFAFLPSDDAYEPEKLAPQIDELRAHQELGAVFSYQTLIGVDGKQILHDPLVEWTRVPYVTKEDIFPALFERNFLSAPSALLRRALVDELGGFDESLAVLQDYDLWMRLLQRSDVRLIHSPLVRVRWHGANQSAHATPDTELERATVLFKTCCTLRIEDVFPSLLPLAEETHAWVFARAYLTLATRLIDSGLQAVWPLARFYLQKALERHPLLQIPPQLEPLLAQSRELRRFTARPAATPRRNPPLHESLVRGAPPAAETGPLTVVHEVRTLDRGGLERIVFDLAVGLNREGFRSVVVCVEAGGYFADRCREAGVPVEILGADQAKAYHAVLRHYAPDLILSHHSFFGHRLASSVGIPVVSVVQNVYAWHREGILDDFRAHDPFVKKYVAVSEDAANYLSWRFNIPKEKIRLIRNAIRVEEFTKPPPTSLTRETFGWSSRDYVFLLVGAICRVKAQRVAVNALAHVVEQFPEARLLMLGHCLEPDYAELVERRIADAGLAAHCRIVGFHEDPRPFYALADAFLLPSLIEGFSLARLEAMAAGLPCITTRVGDAELLFQGGGGLLLDTPYDAILRLDYDIFLRSRLDEHDSTVPALARAMRAFLEDREGWKTEGRRNLERLWGLGLGMAHMVQGYRDLLDAESERDPRQALIRARRASIAMSERVRVLEAREDDKQRTLAELASAFERETAVGAIHAKLEEIHQLNHLVLDRLDLTKRARVRRDQLARYLKYGLPGRIRNRLSRRQRLQAALVEAPKHHNDAAYHQNRRNFLEVLRTPPVVFPEIQAQLAALQKISPPKGIVIYPPTLGWTESLFQRPHQLMRGFARKGYWAFFCSPIPAADKIARLKEVEPNLFVAESLSMLRFLDGPTMVLWISYPQHIITKEVFPQSRVVYDVIDELEVFNLYSQGMEDDHALLLKEADVVAVTADRLIERVRSVRADAILAPNGVWVEDFAPGFPAARPPEDMKRVLDRGAPVIGYHGALAEWFDYALLGEVAAQCPGLSFVLVGPDYDGSLKQLRPQDNVFWLGPKPYRDVRRYVSYFDVGTIPFRVNNITKSTSPIKLFEYMAARKPVVTTDLVECRKYRSVLVATDPASFKDCLARALDLRSDPAFIATARREAEENSWGNRIDSVLSALRKTP